MIDADLPPEALQRYLSDLARLGVRHVIELRPDPETGTMRLVPAMPEHGGYYASRVDDGPPVLLPYDSGRAEWAADDVVGDDMHPSARQDRAREWLADNAEALADKGQRARPGDSFPAAFTAARGTVDPGMDLD